MLLGTDKKDRLAGKDGDDEIRALGAGDLIFGGLGNDVIYAGPGDDGVLQRVQGDPRDGGDDVIYRGSGDEYVEPGKGADVIYGGDGSDYIFALPNGLPDGQRNRLYCGKGMDKYAADKEDFVSSGCEKKEDVTTSPPPACQGCPGDV